MLWLIFILLIRITRFCIVQIDGRYFIGKNAEMTYGQSHAMIGQKKILIYFQDTICLSWTIRSEFPIIDLKGVERRYMEYFCNYLWEQGFRKTNEDSLAIRQIAKNGRTYIMAVVCDGVGGLLQGENASSYVVYSMVETFQKMVRNNRYISSRKIQNMFCRQIYKCHKMLQRYGQKEGIELGTTLSMFMITDNKGYLFHIGDSAFFSGRKKLKKRTVCHHSKNGALLQAIGMGKNSRPQICVFPIHKNYIYLLASDGFYRRCEMWICNKEWLKQVSCDEKKIGELLIYTKEKAQELGEKDNISAICIRTAGGR